MSKEFDEFMDNVDKLGNEDVPKLGYDERKQNLIDIMNDDAKDGLYDVREVEVHSLEILRNKIKNDISELTIFSSSYSGGYKQALIMVEGMIMDMLAQLPQQEISDEEIFKQSIKEMEEWYGSDCKEEIDAHFRGAKWMQKWYREQLKSK